MMTHLIRVSEVNDRKLWQLILKNKWDGACFDQYTYLFTSDQLLRIKKAGVQFEEVKTQPARVREMQIACGARQR